MPSIPESQKPHAMPSGFDAAGASSSRSAGSGICQPRPAKAHRPPKWSAQPVDDEDRLWLVELIEESNELAAAAFVGVAETTLVRAVAGRPCYSATRIAIRTARERAMAEAATRRIA